jgi:hypothetical protein
LYYAGCGFVGRAGTSTEEADWRRQLARAVVYTNNQSPGQAEELIA